MRTSVLIATVGAAAVLGGIVGAALVRLGHNEPPSESHWWCADGLCYRDAGRCAGQCRRSRVAFCPLEEVSVEACFADLTTCDVDAHKYKRNGCVGVE